MMDFTCFTIHREDETKPDRVALILLPEKSVIQTMRSPDPDQPWVADTHVFQAVTEHYEKNAQLLSEPSFMDV